MHHLHNFCIIFFLVLLLYFTTFAAQIQILWLTNGTLSVGEHTH